MKIGRLWIPLLVGAFVAPVLAADRPLTELDQALRELESLVRSLHEVRRSTAAELEKARSTAARNESDARDLEREASSIEDEIGPLRENVQRLEREHEQLEARRARVEKARGDLAAVTSGQNPFRGALDATRSLRVQAARARSNEVDGEAVRLGSLAPVPCSTEAGRALADQLIRRSPPTPVPVTVDLQGLEKP